MGRGTSIGYLPPLGKVRYEVLGDQWHDMVSRKSHKHCTVSGKVPKVSEMAMFGEVGELKNWMLEKPVNNKGCSSIQFLLREIFKSIKGLIKSIKKLFFSFLGLKTSISRNIRNFFRVIFFSGKNIRTFFQGKNLKLGLLSIINFLILGLENSISRNFFRVDFIYFSSLVWKVRQGALYITTLLGNRLSILTWILIEMDCYFFFYMFQRKFLVHPIQVTGSTYCGIAFRTKYISKIYT